MFRLAAILAAIVSASVISGCAGAPTIGQLESAAMISGDWSLVRQREAAAERRKSRSSLNCPFGSIELCEVIGTDSRCYCH